MCRAPSLWQEQPDGFSSAGDRNRVRPGPDLQAGNLLSVLGLPQCACHRKWLWLCPTPKGCCEKWRSYYMTVVTAGPRLWSFLRKDLLNYWRLLCTRMSGILNFPRSPGVLEHMVPPHTCTHTHTHVTMWGERCANLMMVNISQCYVCQIFTPLYTFSFICQLHPIKLEEFKEGKKPWREHGALLWSKGH